MGAGRFGIWPGVQYRLTMSRSLGAVVLVGALLLIALGANLNRPQPDADTALSYLNGAYFLQDSAASTIVVSSVDETDRWSKVSLRATLDGVDFRWNAASWVSLPSEPGEHLTLARNLQSGDVLEFCAHPPTDDEIEIVLSGASFSTPTKGTALFKFHDMFPCTGKSWRPAG
jgi:hypothetical protein